MKKFLCCFALLAGSISGYAADVCTEEGFTFDVRQRDYLLSTVFEFNGKEQFLGSIVKEPFHLRTQYDLYSETGVFQGMGICRILTLGAIYAWGTEIDVYDERGGKVGVIDGQAVTGAAAKFSIYDGKGAHVGIAYLDLNAGAFTLVDPANEKRPLASYRRNFVKDIVDHWDVKVYDACAIDLRLIKIFAGFAIDTQEYFKKDN